LLPAGGDWCAGEKAGGFLGLGEGNDPDGILTAKHHDQAIEAECDTSV
jgi:hypothetical protein